MYSRRLLLLFRMCLLIPSSVKALRIPEHRGIRIFRNVDNQLQGYVTYLRKPKVLIYTTLKKADLIKN